MKQLQIMVKKAKLGKEGIDLGRCSRRKKNIL